MLTGGLRTSVLLMVPGSQRQRDHCPAPDKLLQVEACLLKMSRKDYVGHFKWRMCVWLCLCVCVYLSVHVCLSVSRCFCVCMAVCLSVCDCVCVYETLCTAVCVNGNVSLCVSPSVCLCVHLCNCGCVFTCAEWCLGHSGCSVFWGISVIPILLLPDPTSLFRSMKCVWVEMLGRAGKHIF
jgi:hypothetical protein